MVQTTAAKLPPGPATTDGSLSAEQISSRALGWCSADDVASLLDQVADAALSLLPVAVGAAVITVAAQGEARLLAARGVLPDVLLAHPHHLVSRQAIRPSLDETLTGVRNPRAGSLTAARWSTAVMIDAPRHDLVFAALGTPDEPFGTLTVVLDRRHTKPSAHPQLRREAATIAILASIALHDQRTRLQQAHALRSQEVIGQVEGILMERRNITAAAAHDYLVQLSQITNADLQVICTDFLATGQLPAHHGPRPVVVTGWM